MYLNQQHGSFGIKANFDYGTNMSSFENREHIKIEEEGQTDAKKLRRAKNSKRKALHDMDTAR